jgi:hypothetical protein
MGFDMWLPSIFDYDSPQGELLSAVDGDRVSSPIYKERVYDAMRATGAYYREGDNGRGLLSLLGLSWHEIMDSLEDRTTLPPTRARHLLAELEKRPFTKAMLFAERQETATEQPMPPSPREFDLSEEQINEACSLYAKRRQELMALLRRAIERNEPLRIDG